MTDQQRHDEKVNKANTESTVQERIAEQKRKFLIAYTEHKGIVKYACEAIKISRTTFYEWRNEDAAFAQACIDACEAAIDHVEHKLHKLINKGDTTAILFYMRCKAKQRGFVERQEIAPVNPDGSALSTTQINVNVLYPEGYVPPPGEAPVVTVKQDQQQ
jgi:hypothetical protein